VHRVPFPPDKGDRIRSFHLLNYLSRRARVHLACLEDEPVTDETVATLHCCCERLAVVPLGPRQRWFRALASVVRGRTISEGAFDSPQLRAVLQTWAKDTTFVGALASASSVAPYLQSEQLKHVPAVVDLVDVDSQKWQDYAETSRGPRRWLY